MTKIKVVWFEIRQFAAQCLKHYIFYVKYDQGEGKKMNVSPLDRPAPSSIFKAIFNRFQQPKS